MVTMPRGTAHLLKKVQEAIPPSMVACLFAGMALGYIFVAYSWKMSVLFFGVLIVAAITFFWTEYSLYLFFVLLVMTTDTVYEGMFEQQDFFAIPEIDLPGLPSALNLLFLLMFAIFFFKRYALEKRLSLIPLKYLLAYIIVISIALATGATHPKATSDSLRLEFIKMLLPVLGFYMYINVLDDQNKIKKMIRVLFCVCVVKSIILDLYYLAGRGFPYGEYRIVSFDTAELMTFVMMLLYCIMMITYRHIRGMQAWLLPLASFPLLFALLFSFRRGHWIGMLLSLALLYLWSPPRQRSKVRPYLLGFVVLLIPVLCFFVLTNASLLTPENSGPSMVFSRFMTLFDPEQASNRHHLYESTQVLKDIIKSPFFGLGLASEHSPVNEDLGMWLEELQPLQIVHNTFIYMWMKTGLLGLFFFLWWCYKYTKEVTYYVKNYRYSEDWPLTASMGSGIGIWLIMFMTGPVPFYLHQTYLIALFSAMVLSLIRLDKYRGSSGKRDSESKFPQEKGN